MSDKSTKQYEQEYWDWIEAEEARLKDLFGPLDFDSLEPDFAFLGDVDPLDGMFDMSPLEDVDSIDNSFEPDWGELAFIGGDPFGPYPSLEEEPEAPD